ncbi:thymidylate synthase, flavin-dependent [Tardibacter chloracetimidivorans]|uniref:FAD-dependent thymidylate synthase n=1 Tax=Tardibacter chloracetimidivorans TaxID=1921510 RepID=A0A1L3ZS81_9SPHN|nr:FAD-dependent thymidylate synthase [Tardibacter chloracetimidivorans]API58479.1 thymidylate synthase, flavin-dependent [Tardibacter chloracetimidivorans]
MKTTNEYGATLLETMGTDLSVVNAARVSFDKESDWVSDNDPVEPSHVVLSARDQKLIHYLAKEGHWSPFAHAFLKFRVKAPIFVARQLQKHQVGLSWNEVSRRYVDSEPEFYVPREWRKKAEDKKQGSSDEVVSVDLTYEDMFLDALIGVPLANYNGLLEQGVCPEQARMVLPQSTMTEWIWSGSLYAFSRVCKERLHPSAQRETRWVAEDISQALATHFPVSWQALGPKDSINVS